jgi:hypothetical protein
MNSVVVAHTSTDHSYESRLALGDTCDGVCARWRDVVVLSKSDYRSADAWRRTCLSHNRSQMPTGLQSWSSWLATRGASMPRCCGFRRLVCRQRHLATLHRNRRAHLARVSVQGAGSRRSHLV